VISAPALLLYHVSTTFARTTVIGFAYCALCTQGSNSDLQTFSHGFLGSGPGTVPVPSALSWRRWPPLGCHADRLVLVGSIYTTLCSILTDASLREQTSVSSALQLDAVQAHNHTQSRVQWTQHICLQHSNSLCFMSMPLQNSSFAPLASEYIFTSVLRSRQRLGIGQTS